MLKKARCFLVAGAVFCAAVLLGVGVFAAEEPSAGIPAVFAITRPESGKELKTSYANYFITGTSNPASPVYFGNQQIQRLGSQGTFGVYVALAMGANTFTFSQDGQQQTVTIVRTAPAGTMKIKEIQQASMVPASKAGVKNGKTLAVGCTAPAGASVTAAYNGKSVQLQQTKADIGAGYPAPYTGKLPIAEDVNPDETRMGEKVVYTLSYAGESRAYTSTGNVYVAGQNSRIAAEVSAYLGFVYPDLEDLSNFKETVKAGARDEVVGETNLYFQLASGGYLPKARAEIVTGKVQIENQLSSASYAAAAKTETFTFHGTRSPMYDTWVADNTLYLRMYNTAGTPKLDTGSSRLVASSSVSKGENSVTYQFPLSGIVWGFDVSFGGGDLRLTLRHKPTLSSSSDKPLSGLTVLLDPGHGGDDPGALGLAGKTGPDEADANLSNALAVRSLLVQKGANVVMTRDADTTLSLDDRLKMIEENNADLFVSLHHNSLGENVDANKVSGMEIYYHTAFSKKFANTMMGSLSTNLNRNNRSVSQSYYRVTLMHHSPALLLELGFMSNPVEYEKAMSAPEMQKVAKAVTDGIVQILR